MKKIAITAGLVLTILFPSLVLAETAGLHRANELKEFVSVQEAFKAGRLSFDGFISYISFLTTKADTYKVDLKRFPNLARLMDMQKLLTYLDFDQVEIEGQVLVNYLMKSLPKERREELIDKSNDFKNNKITDRAYYAYLIEAAQKTGLSLAGCPNFTNYVEYIKLARGFREENLFRDIEAFNATIIARLTPIQGRS